MTAPADIRALADGLLEDQLAGLDFDEAVERVALFALAVLDALDATEAIEEAVGSSDRLECLRNLRAAIARNMEARRGG